MIIGIGTDLVQVNRIEITLKKFGTSFEEKIFTPFERERAQKLPDKKQASFYAKRFAAKEAFSKALGCGIGKEAFFQDIEVRNDEKGAPFFVIKGKALTSLKEKTKGQPYQIHLSLSDEKDFALCFVVIETTN